MNDFLSRRSLLAGLGSTAVYGSLATQFASPIHAGEAAPPEAPSAASAQEMVYSTMFMAGPKTKFDAKKYESKHLPLLKQFFGSSVSRIEMHTANATAKGVPSDIRVMTYIYIAELQGFIKALSANSTTINADLEGISKGPRNVQVDRVLTSIGAPRSEVRESHQVVSTFYKDKPDATFNLEYFTGTYLPKLRSYYNDSAVRRIEVSVGMPQGGVKPAIMASIHMFVRDRDAYNSANGEGQRETMRLDTNYTNITDFMFADSKVTAIL
jgi:hypothetical protein